VDDPSTRDSAKSAKREKTRRSRLRGLAVAYFSFSTAMLVWPLHGLLGNRVHPRVLGLPWSITYVLAIIAANFAVLLVLYGTQVTEDEHE